MTKKFIIHNLCGGSGFYFKGLKIFNGCETEAFSSNALEAKQFDERHEAEIALENMLPKQIQQTEQNKFWNYGYIFTILEVYV